MALAYVLHLENSEPARPTNRSRLFAFGGPLSQGAGWARSAQRGCGGEIRLNEVGGSAPHPRETSQIAGWARSAQWGCGGKIIPIEDRARERFGKATSQIALRARRGCGSETPLLEADVLNHSKRKST